MVVRATAPIDLSLGDTAQWQNLRAWPCEHQSTQSVTFFQTE